MTKAEIIQSAFETWGATGYQNTSLAALAGALGVTKTALYHHFRNKDDILTAMYDTFFDSLADNVRPFFEDVLACAEGCADETKILEAVLLINGRITEFFAKNPWYFIFSLIKVHRNMDVSFDVPSRLKEKGLDFEKIDQIKNRLNEKKPYTTVFQFIFTASVCITAHFLGVLWTEGRLETGFHEITGRVNRFVRHCFGFRREAIASLD